MYKTLVLRFLIHLWKIGYGKILSFSDHGPLYCFFAFTLLQFNTCWSGACFHMTNPNFLGIIIVLLYLMFWCSMYVHEWLNAFLCSIKNAWLLLFVPCSIWHFTESEMRDLWVSLIFTAFTNLKESWSGWYNHQLSTTLLENKTIISIKIEKGQAFATPNPNWSQNQIWLQNKPKSSPKPKTSPNCLKIETKANPKQDQNITKSNPNLQPFSNCNI